MESIGCLLAILFFPLSLVGALFSSGSSTNSKKSSSRYSEEELNSYGLLEEEKELVRKGEYDPWQFDEEEAEEDDYYYEDWEDSHNGYFFM